MLSIQLLFNETKNDIDKRHAKRISIKCRKLKNAEKKIPHMDYPRVGTDDFYDDLKEVMRSMTDSCLSSKFLNLSNKSVKKTYKSFLKTAERKINWEEIEDLLEEVDSIVLRLKYKYARKRPYHYLNNNNIHKSKSFSFPSGHTTLAYFLSRILENKMPELSGELNTLAEMVAQSRLENGVHFPTDIEYGKLIGEILASDYNDNTCKINKSFKNFLRERQNNNSNFLNDFSNFIHKTNQIESYRLSLSECRSAAKEITMGYPTKYITDNPHIQSTLNSLKLAYELGKVDTLSKIIQVHKQFDASIIERLKPGSIRNFNHFSPSGIQYSKPEKIASNLKKCFLLGSQPILKHVVYEWIHPFGDGNGRSGRVMLASDMNFDFASVNNYLENNYIKNLTKYMSDRKVENLLNSM